MVEIGAADRATISRPAFARSIWIARCPARTIRRPSATRPSPRAPRACARWPNGRGARRRRGAGLCDRHRSAGARRRTGSAHRIGGDRGDGGSRDHRRASERVPSAQGLHHVWPRVIGLVVQPGVEFDHHQVIDFRAARTVDLVSVVESQPHMVFEAHSTDYQTPANLRALVRTALCDTEGRAGVDLRHARSAVGAGCKSSASCWARTSPSPAARDDARGVMTRYPRSLEQILPLERRGSSALDQQYSLSDRIRYYWPVPAVEAALNRLLAHLDANPPPLTLVSQYLPLQYAGDPRRADPTARARTGIALHSRRCCGNIRRPAPAR